MKISERQKNLWADMAALTAPLCAGKAPGGCRAPHSCCDPMYCDMAIEYAKEAGETLDFPGTHPHLALMGPGGCTAPPHLRPCCTLHVCCINSLGANLHDLGWNKKYFRLRAKLEKTLVAIS